MTSKLRPVLSPRGGTEPRPQRRASHVRSTLRPPSKPPLEFLTVAELAHRVDSSPPVGFLCRPVIPADAYGVAAAAAKTGKTWGILDLAVSVASGTPWLGTFAIERQGPVLVFLGEGGERKMLRRLRAIAAAKDVRVEDDLAIDVCFRVPHLASREHMAVIEQKLREQRPVLVIIDPLYLAARGAKSADLYDMGSHLESVQAVAQEAGAALLLVTHWNKSGTGKGAERMTGAGPAEWGRVLVSVDVEQRHGEKDTKASVVTLAWSFVGDEITDTNLRIRRRIWADDPDDLTSPLHYEVETVADDATTVRGAEGMRPATARVLAALEAAAGSLDVREIGDVVAEDSKGPPLKARTIQAALRELEGEWAEVDAVEGRAQRWRALRRADTPSDGA